jgi:selenocysteine lyase/cysteine desulfurase
MKTIPSQRHLFDIPDDIAYFNCSYYSPQLNESRNRLLSGVNEKSKPWERTPSSFFEDAEVIRHLSSEIFGGDTDGYAISPAASYGLSTAARAIEPQLNKKDQILLIAEEFPSNVLPWRRVAMETGSDIITVPTPNDGDWTQAILNQLNKKIKVVTISSCHWTNGAKIDLATIGKACRDTGCIFVVDATQSLGAMSLTIEEVKPDFLVASGYKWLLCPYGFSLLYISEQWRNSRPLEETWLARDHAEDFAGLVNYSDKYMNGSRRFDVGEKCTPTILPGAIAALEQIKHWGVQPISDSLSTMNNGIASHLVQIGFQLPDDTQRCPHMFGAKIPDAYTGNLVSELRERNIFISQRGKSIRFAPHLHITDNDINHLLETMDDLVS